MDAFDDQHAVTGQTQLLAVELTLSCDEIVFGDFYRLAFHQTGEVIAQKLVVDCFDIVEVVLSIWQLGGIHTVHEIVVGGKREGTKAACQQLDRQSLAECGLARA